MRPSLFQEKEVEGTFGIISTHPKEGLVAVQGGGKDGDVCIVDEHGSIVQKVGAKGGGSVSCLTWHPSKPILAIGYTNGFY